MKRLARKAYIAPAAAIAVAALTLAIALYLRPYPAEPIDYAASDATEVRMLSEDGSVQLWPGKSAKAGLVFYVGARVPPEAYAPLLRPLAEAGVAVFIPKLPFNFAIFGVGKAAEVMESAPDIPVWYVGGHSLGGASAAMFADKHRDEVAGVVFLAAYPGGGTDLSDFDGGVLSISATEDGLATAAKLEAARPLLPADTAYVSVKGGNHAGFGRYGAQKGDGAASLPRETQEALTAAAIVDFIKAGE